MRGIFNRREAAKYAGVSQRTILRAIASKQLAAEKLGDARKSTYIISQTALEGYIQRKGRR